MTFDGICIGGPMAGQRLAHPACRFLCETRPPITLRPGSHTREAPKLGKQFVYVHQHIGSTGVWVLETENTDSVMRRLLAIYMAATQEDREDD